MIACAERPDLLRGCLDSLKRSCEGIETEFVVASSLDGSAVKPITDAYPEVTLTTLGQNALVPHLWAEGIASSRGRIVALTISQCSATKGWAGALISTVTGGAAVAGGALALDPDASITDTAIFFLRYSAFIAGRVRYRAGAIAGDNSAYTRDTLESGGWTRESGFWEVEVNELLRQKGKRIEFAPDAVMLFGGAGGVIETAKRRYEHGRRFGATRKREWGESVIRIVMASPLVPLVLFARATRRAWPVKQYRLGLLAAIPAFAVLSASWALGEAVGALEAGVANRN